MLNQLFRRAARLAHALLFRVAAPCVCTWVGWGPAAQAAEPQTAEQAASVPLRHYQGWREEPLQDWRRANERVGEVGGWRTYLREAQPAADGANNGQAQHGHPGH